MEGSQLPAGDCSIGEPGIAVVQLRYRRAGERVGRRLDETAPTLGTQPVAIAPDGQHLAVVQQRLRMAVPPPDQRTPRPASSPATRPSALGAKKLTIEIGDLSSRMVGFRPFCGAAIADPVGNIFEAPTFFTFG